MVDCINSHRRLPEEQTEHYLDVQDYYSYFANRITIEFLPLPTGAEANANATESFEIELSRLTTYSQLEDAVAEQVHCDPTFLRFTHSVYV